MVFLGHGRMVCGTPPAVEDAIDVMAGLQEPISGTVRNMYNELGSAPIKLVSNVPESFTEQIPTEVPFGPMDISLLSFRDIEYTTIVIAKNQAIINADIHLRFANEHSAKESGHLLWTAVTVGKRVIPDPDAKELLSKMRTSRSKSSISITITMTVSEIERLALSTLAEAD